MDLPRGVDKQRRTKPQDSKWQTAAELAKSQWFEGTRDGKASLLLGQHDGTWIGSADDRHVLTVAGSRAGKSSTCLKPNLLLWPSSVLCIDPKGELAEMSAPTRAAMGQDVFILDPFHEVKAEHLQQYRVGYNPMAELLESGEAHMIDDSALLAEAMIISDGKGEQHWVQSAKNVWRGFALFTLLMQQKGGETATLPLLRELISLSDGGDEGKDATTLSGLFRLMQNTGDELGGVVRRSGSTMAGKREGERTSIFSTAIEQTAFLDSTELADHLKGGGGLTTLRQLKQRPTTIYLVLPATRIVTHSRWLRVILTLALAALEREKMQLPAPVLFVLEEFPQLGYMRQIEAAAGLVASYGVKLWTICQDLSQLKNLYRESWETFIGNAGIVQAFGNVDPTTTEFLSRRLGTLRITESQATGVTASGSAAGGAGSRETSSTVPLLAPFEIELLGDRDLMTAFVLMAGKPPAYLDRITHEEVARLAR